MTKAMYVCGIVLFLTLCMSKFYAGRYIDDFVNKTSHDLGRACVKCGNGAIEYCRILP